MAKPDMTLPRNMLLWQACRRLTAARVAELAGVKEITLRAWLSRRHAPVAGRYRGAYTPAVEAALAELCGVEPAELFPEAAALAARGLVTPARRPSYSPPRRFASLRCRRARSLCDDGGLAAVDKAHDRRWLRDRLLPHLLSLRPRYLRVLELRYGLWGAEPVRLAAVARDLGLTKGRVWQIQNRALKQLWARMRDEPCWEAYLD